MAGAPWERFATPQAPAQPAQSTPQEAAPWARFGTTPAQEPEQSALRSLGLGTRDVIEGLAQFPGMVYDAAAVPFNLGIAGYNALMAQPTLSGLITGEQPHQIPQIKRGSEYVRAGTDAIGLPKPETAAERIQSAAQQGAASMLVPLGIGSKMAGAADATVSNAGRILSADPIGQMASGAGAQGGGQTAQEMGYGPVGQAVATVGGALAAPMVTGAAGRIISPQGTPDANAMRASGVDVPIGRKIGGLAEDAEGVLRNQGIGGGAVRAAEQRAVNQSAVAALNEAFKPIGVSFDTRATVPGNQLWERAQQTIDGMYKRVGQMLTGKADDALITDLSGVVRTAQRLPEAERAALTQELSRLNLPQGQPVDGQKIVDAYRAFRDLARDAAGNPATKNLGEAYGQIRDALQSFMGRISPEAAQARTAIDQAWLNLKPIERAARQAASDGVFSPEQLVRASGQVGGTRTTAGGNAPLQDFAQPAARTLEGATRKPQGNDIWSMIGSPLSLGVGAVTWPLYAQGAQPFMQWATSPRQNQYARAMAEALRSPGYGTRATIGAANVGR